MKETINVEIFGESYLLKSDSDAEYVMKIAAEINQAMRGIRQKTHSFSNERIAVLAALELADRYFKLKKDYDDLLQLVESKSRQK